MSGGVDSSVAACLMLSRGYVCEGAAMRLFRSFRQVTVCSAVLSVTCALLGIVLAALLSTPVGSTIVAVDLAVFLIFSLIALAGRKVRAA